MNAFDKALIDQGALNGLDGLWGSIKRSVKKVAKKTVKFVKTSVKAPVKVIRKTIEDPKHILNHAEEGLRETVKAANHVRTALYDAAVPSKAREVINKTAAKVANNKMFRMVATAVASAYGLGLAANAAFTTLDAYNAKLLAEKTPINVPLAQALSPAELKKVKESLEFLLPLSALDQNKILKTLSPPLQAFARKWLQQNRFRDPAVNATTQGKIATTAAFNAGQGVGTTPEIQLAINQLVSQGKSPAEIANIIKSSHFFKQTMPDIKVATMAPLLAAQYGQVPGGDALAIQTARQVKPYPSWLPVAGAALLVVGLT